MKGFFTGSISKDGFLRQLKGSTLTARFIAPPFSVLDARQGYWQERKRLWLALGIQSELGRGADLVSGSGRCIDNGQSPIQSKDAANLLSPGGSPRPSTTLGKDGKTQRGDGKGRVMARTFGSGHPGDLHEQYKQKTLGAIAPNEAGANGILTSPGKYAVGSRKTDGNHLNFSPSTTISRGGGKIGHDGSKLLGHKQSASVDGLTVGVTRDAYRQAGEETTAAQGSGTSIFDPVLCELAYRWFCPQGGTILDPFAGGSVRGITAAVLGYKYTGIDLSPGQLRSNNEQAQQIIPSNVPTWIEGNSTKVRDLTEGPFDFVFSCPPYFSLEKYSDRPEDLSNMTEEGFLAAYAKIIRRSLSLLKSNRFACFVVGNTRGKNHCYTHLPEKTTQIFEEAGALLYNDAILVTAVGSLPLRIKKQFVSYRKLGRTHQNVLVFIKGDYKKACKAIRRHEKD